jgi:hypothetical protein
MDHCYNNSFAYTCFHMFLPYRLYIYVRTEIIQAIAPVRQALSAHKVYLTFNDLVWVNAEFRIYTLVAPGQSGTLTNAIRAPLYNFFVAQPFKLNYIITL